MSELAKALAKAQSEFPTIERSKDVVVKTKTGGSYTFAYAPLDAIAHAVAAPLRANDLTYSQLLSNIEGKAALRTVLMHSSGETLEDVCPLPMNGSVSAQEFGSLVTYMRRYALVALLGIATEEDDDGNHASGNTATSSGAGGTSGGSVPAPDDSEYLAATARAQDAGAKPSDQVLHWSRNKGKRLDELTPKQLEWYANEWKLQDDPSPYDVRLKFAAQALLRGDDTPEALRYETGDPNADVTF
jgi:hypothetical protein